MALDESRRGAYTVGVAAPTSSRSSGPSRPPIPLQAGRGWGRLSGRAPDHRPPARSGLRVVVLGTLRVLSQLRQRELRSDAAYVLSRVIEVVCGWHEIGMSPHAVSCVDPALG